jgi:hypothetical protein
MLPPQERNSTVMNSIKQLSYNLTVVRDVLEDDNALDDKVTLPKRDNQVSNAK